LIYLQQEATVGHLKSLESTERLHWIITQLSHYILLFYFTHGELLLTSC